MIDLTFWVRMYTYLNLKLMTSKLIFELHQHDDDDDDNDVTMITFSFLHSLQRFIFLKFILGFSQWRRPYSDRFNIISSNRILFFFPVFVLLIVELIVRI